MENEVRELEQAILKHRDLYYNGQPKISDAAYDALEDELRALAPESEVLQAVGAPPGENGWGKVEHQIPMGSLNKANSMEDVVEWLDQLPDEIGIIWTEKMDGISVALRYKNGYFVQALTRGDGEEGEDITRNVRMMQGVPKVLNKSLTGDNNFDHWYRGEIVLPHDAFEKHFEGYSNPRNAASGTARAQDPEKAKRCKHLQVYTYEKFSEYPKMWDKTDEYFHSIQLIEKDGLTTPNWGGSTAWKVDGPEHNLETIETVFKDYVGGKRDGLNYDIDGLVLRVSGTKLFNELGDYHGNPRGAIALKFEAEAETTVLTDVLWQIGNSKRVTPVAVFDTVELAGAEVSRASLYNMDYIRELMLNIGDQILVSRVNDVIPRVEAVVAKNNPGYVAPPINCPSCGSALKTVGKYLECHNQYCDAALAGYVKKWVDKLDLLDWGDTLIDSLVDFGHIQYNPSELYDMGVESLAGVPNSGGAILGEKKARRLIKKLHSKQHTEITLDQFVGGLNIPLIGQRTVLKFMKAGYNTLEALQNGGVKEFESIDGIGPERAEAMVEGLDHRANDICDLLKHVSIVDNEGPLVGKSFCFTGKLSRPRKQIEKDVKAAGGETKSSVSKSLSYLVCNNPESKSSKAKKARRYGVTIIGESDLLEMM